MEKQEKKKEKQQIRRNREQWTNLSMLLDQPIMRLNQNTLTSYLYCMRLYNPSAFMTVVHGPSIYPNKSRNVENFVLNPDPNGLEAAYPL